MRRPLPILAAIAALAVLAGAGQARAATGIAPARGFAPHQVVVKFAGEASGHAVGLPAGVGVREAAAALRDNPRVAYAEPNYLATASAAEPALRIPNDSGTLQRGAGASAAAGSWTFKQWNFMPFEGETTAQLRVSRGGIDAVGAWQNLIEAGRPGAEGVTVAVLDTGVAYRGYEGGRYKRSPDFTPQQFVPGYDFVGRDAVPLDRNGHGTHVAGTIAEKTNNAIGLTGLAYRAKLMPVRVLDQYGRGSAARIAKGIRFAIKHHAQVINMSFNFPCGARVPAIDEALQKAFEHGIVAVASAGNLHEESCVAQPATGPHVIGVGGSTAGGCLGRYSLTGAGVDLLAPGGGEPIRGCRSRSARPIYQVTLARHSTANFAIPDYYVGTSMAAAHVSGVAAMVIASGAIATPTTPEGLVRAVTQRLRHTARNVGLSPLQQGAGLIDAEAATAPAP